MLAKTSIRLDTYRYISLFLVFLIFGISAYSQERLKFQIENFSQDVFDTSASNPKYEKYDGNGDRYAIIKVKSSNPEDNLRQLVFNFGNMKHIVDNEDHNGELWVYVMRNAKTVTITRDGYYPINRYDLQTTIEPGKNYVMEINSQGKKIFTQMVQFNVKPSDSKAVIMVKRDRDGSSEEYFGVIDSEGSVAKPLEYGDYYYKVLSDNYHIADGRFTLNDRMQIFEENIALSSNYSVVTLNADGDAEIYVNGEKKGIGQWSGILNSGSYEVECRQKGHKTTSQIINVTENDNLTINLETPIPILGMVAVTSVPLGAVITIDGMKYGKTPKVFELPVGNYELILSKKNCHPDRQSFSVREDETTNLSANLEVGTVSEKDLFEENIHLYGDTLHKGKIFIVGDVYFKMMSVDGGTFRMGSDDSEAELDEKPVHEQTLDSFMIGQTEVTQALWDAVMGDSSSNNAGGSNLPVDNVTWTDCLKFIRKLNEITGERFRLPTEAEWEFAARGGNMSAGYKYSGSDNIDEVAWYSDNSGSKPHKVGAKKPNELGIYDMSGNVREWTLDLWRSDYKTESVNSNRVFRGGSCDYSAKSCRVSSRDNYAPDMRRGDLGFRLAL